MTEINIELLTNMEKISILLNNIYSMDFENRKRILNEIEGILSNNKLFICDKEEILQDVYKKEEELLKEFKEKMKIEKEKIESTIDDPLKEKDAYTESYFNTRLWMIGQLYILWNDIIKNRLL